MEVLKFKFDEINMMSRLIASRAESDNFTHVLGIARGGLVPATILSYELDLPLITCSVSSYNGTKRNELQVNHDIKLSQFTKDSNLLLVDDICDTGETMQWLSNRLTLADIKHSKACIFSKAKHIEYLSHYGSVVPDDKWIVFPWE